MMSIQRSKMEANSQSATLDLEQYASHMVVTLLFFFE